MIRIIGGEKSGFVIKSPQKIRPILARIKKSVFDIIKLRIVDSLFLDLYAGSGAVGLESLSRGAKFCFFVEKNSKCVSTLYENIKHLQYEEKSFVVRADILKDLFWIDKARKVVSRYDKKNFDIIFIGAPYFEKVFDENFSQKRKLLNLCSDTVKLIYNSELLRKEGLLIVQHSIKESVDFYNFKHLKTEEYSDTIVDFLTL